MKNIGYLFLLLFLLCLGACAFNPPAITEQEILNAGSLVEKKALFNKASRLITRLDGEKRLNNQVLLNRLGTQIAQEMVSTEAQHIDALLVQSQWLKLSTIIHQEKKLKSISEYDRRAIAGLKKRLQAEKGRTEQMLEKSLSDFEQGDTSVESITALKNAFIFSHPSSRQHVALDNALKETYLNYKLNAQQALESHDFEQAIYYAGLAKAVEDSADVQSLFHHAEAGKVNQKVKALIREGSYYAAAQTLLDEAERPHYYARKVHWQASLTDIIQYFQQATAEAGVIDDYLQRYENALLLNSLYQITGKHSTVEYEVDEAFLERIYNAARRADQKNRSGLELGLLLVIQTIDADYPGVAEQLRWSRKRILFQSGSRTGVLPFETQQAHPGTGTVLAKSIVDNLNQRAPAQGFNYLFVSDASKLNDRRYRVDNLLTGNIRSVRVERDATDLDEGQVLELSVDFDLSRMVSGKPLAGKALTAKVKLEGTEHDMAAEQYASLKKETLETLLADVANTIADEMIAVIDSPIFSFADRANKRLKEGSDSDAIEAIAPIVVMGEDQKTIELWQKLLIEKSLAQAMQLNAR